MIGWLKALGGLFSLITAFLTGRQREKDREAGRNEQRAADAEKVNKVKDAELQAAVNNSGKPVRDSLLDNTF